MDTTAILTGILVLITAYYAWQTRKTVAVMNEANELQNRPVVSIAVRERPESISFLDFVVTNAGHGLARDITFRVVGKNFLIKEVGNRKEMLEDFRVIKNGIKALAPGESRRYWMMSILGRIEEIQDLDTKIEITYFGTGKKTPYVETFDVDFLSLPEYQLGDDPAYKSGKELEKIRKALENIAKDLSKR